MFEDTHVSSKIAEVAKWSLRNVGQSSNVRKFLKITRNDIENCAQKQYDYLTRLSEMFYP